jgi:hypothetical protein
LQGNQLPALQGNLKICAGQTEKIGNNNGEKNWDRAKLEKLHHFPTD